MIRILLIALILPGSLMAQLPDSIFVSKFEREAFQNFEVDSSVKSQLALFLATSSSTTSEHFEKIYWELIKFNEQNQLSKSSRHLFHTVQDSYLIHYSHMSDMTAVFDDTLFSCVTGSALIAFFLEHNDMPYTIVEMPNHVFVKADKGPKSYILESTDPRFGFLRDNRINRTPYTPDTIDHNYVFKLISGYSHLDMPGLVVKSEITLYELAGLNYYNEAVKDLNDENFADAIINLQKAYYLYPSRRIAEIYKYCLIRLIEDKSIDFNSRALYHKQLTKLVYPLTSN